MGIVCDVCDMRINDLKQFSLKTRCENDMHMKDFNISEILCPECYRVFGKHWEEIVGLIRKIKSETFV